MYITLNTLSNLSSHPIRNLLSSDLARSVAIDQSDHSGRVTFSGVSAEELDTYPDTLIQFGFLLGEIEGRPSLGQGEPRLRFIVAIKPSVSSEPNAVSSLIFRDWLNVFYPVLVEPYGIPKAAESYEIGWLEGEGRILAKAVVRDIGTADFEALELHFSPQGQPAFSCRSTFSLITGLKLYETSPTGKKNAEYFPFWPTSKLPRIGFTPDSKGGRSDPNEGGGDPSDERSSSIRPDGSSIELTKVGIPVGWMHHYSIDLEELNELECDYEAGCFRFKYRAGHGWAGVYWWPPACGTFGSDEVWNEVRSGKCGIDIARVGNMRSVDSITFSARGERGGESIMFGIGGHDLPPRRKSETFTLTASWVPYKIEVQDLDLRNATGLFFWIATDQNESGAIFYLSDVRFIGKGF